MLSLHEKARWVWQQTLKIHQRSPETRVASSLSCIEIFVTLYYAGMLKFFPNDPYNENRDRCIISKGHGSLCMYPILADLGFFNLDELENVCKPGSILGGIPDPVIPGYETVNGSLGHGMGVGAGVAIALKARHKDCNVIVVVGDGELHEGANWEAAMFSAQKNIDNLLVIVDDNKTCMLDHTINVVDHVSLQNKFEAFGWECEQCDGHSLEELNAIIQDLLNRRNNKPKVLLANTIKGKGVPGLENEPLSHVMAIDSNKIDQLIQEKN